MTSFASIPSFTMMADTVSDTVAGSMAQRRRPQAATARRTPSANRKCRSKTVSSLLPNLSLVAQPL